MSFATLQCPTLACCLPSTTSHPRSSTPIVRRLWLVSLVALEWMLMARRSIVVLDALIVGMDMLINKKGKYDKRIFLVTDGGQEANTDGIEMVLDQFKRMSAKLNIMYAIQTPRHHQRANPDQPTNQPVASTSPTVMMTMTNNRSPRSRPSRPSRYSNMSRDRVRRDFDRECVGVGSKRGVASQDRQGGRRCGGGCAPGIAADELLPLS